MADRVGQQLGNYHLIRLLGKGGFGEVYEAEHRLLHRKQAIKVLLEDHFDNSKFLERFLREAQTLAMLDHPNIVHVDELGMEGSLVYLVMPYISGGTLHQILKKPAGILGLNETERYLKEICAGLEYAHARKVVHLDLKPLNLLVHEDGRLLLSDFGLAHLMEQGAVEGGTSLFFGTPHYMAPEHLDGQPGQQSDLYAAGVILYQMLTGRLPFDGSTPRAVMLKVITESPPSLREVRPDLPAALESVINKALAKNPEERYHAASELLEAFRSALPGRLSQPLAGPFNASEPTRYASPGLAPTMVAANPPGIPLAGQPIQRQPVSSLPSFSSSVTMPLLVYQGHTEAVYAVAWSRDGRYLASGGGNYETKKDSSVHIYEALTGKPFGFYRQHTNVVMSLAWAPDGRRIASASLDQSTRVWEVITGRDVYTLKSLAAYVDWSPDGRYLVSGSPDSLEKVHIWQALTGGSTFSYPGHKNRVVQAAWSPDGMRLASGSWDQTVQIWGLVEKDRRVTYQGHVRREAKDTYISALAWSPDGKYVASSDSTGATVHIWDAVTGRLAFVYKGHARPITALAWSPTTGLMASASGDQTVQIWEALTGRQLITYEGHANGVRAVAWSPDGIHIASASRDRMVHVWKPW